jgi:hypothetical protein
MVGLPEWFENPVGREPLADVRVQALVARLGLGLVGVSQLLATQLADAHLRRVASATELAREDAHLDALPA